jgi:tetratricopeptide (TPR) repeat protein
MPHRSTLALGLLLPLTATMSCRRTDETVAAADKADQRVTAPRITADKAAADKVSAATAVDGPIDAWRADLIDLAFRTASLLPPVPHVKTRNRLQESAVDAWLQLGQPQRAQHCIEQISDWRRGTAYASRAIWYAQHNDAAAARADIEHAGEVTRRHDVKADQEWRGERIQRRIDEAEVLLKRAPSAEPPSFETTMHDIDSAVTAGNMDSILAALHVAAKVFGNVYGDAQRRATAEEKLRNGRKRLPADMAFDLTAEFADVAFQHGDTIKARELADEAQRIVDEAQWLPADHIPLLARIARLRGRVGDNEGAAKAAASGLALYDRERAKMVDVEQAGALRPLAVAYQALGRTEAAIAVYRLAVDAGALNPNSRPRAEDLCTTCCSMALSGVQPDARLHARLVQIHEGLGTPW